MTFNEKYSFYQTKFENFLKDYLSTIKDKTSEFLYSSISYSVTDGGKRIRPVLLMAFSDFLGVDFEQIKYFALAIEFIHSYSLVHDDLPCMDNDDYRRGKLSTHKKFGEANGCLTGDALLNLAFETIVNNPDCSSIDIEAIKILSVCSGFSGMILGQSIDVNQMLENNEKSLFNLFELKTSKLITAPILIASVFADKKYYKELETFGRDLGILFQITDDILDVEGSVESIGKTPGKDKEENKITSVSLFGLDGAKEKAKVLYLSCKSILEKINANDFLLEFLDKVYTRRN